MSCGLMPSRAPPGPGWTESPSITYSGSMLPLIDELPLIRMATPPSGVRVTITPGTREASVFSIASSVAPARSMSSPVTVVPGWGTAGDPEGAGFSTGGVAFPEAQPEARPNTRAQERARGDSVAI